jgi:hypothetical protein
MAPSSATATAPCARKDNRMGNKTDKRAIFQLRNDPSHHPIHSPNSNRNFKLDCKRYAKKSEIDEIGIQGKHITRSLGLGGETQQKSTTE